MHLAIDCRAVHPRMGGIGRAAWDLACEMTRQAYDHRITVLKGPLAPESFVVPGADVESVTGAMIDESFEQFQLPSILERLRVDVYLNPLYSVPAVKTTVHQVAFIQDVLFEDRPEWVAPHLRAYLSRWARLTALESSHVLTPSEYARSRIRTVYGIEDTRITRVHHGARAEWFIPPDPRDVERAVRKFALPSPFILYLGTVEPKNGVLALVDAFSRLAMNGFKGCLALAAGRSDVSCDLEGAVIRSGVSRQIRVLGQMEDAERKALLAACALFVHPSLYEGFGFLPLEAMALGRPTVVSGETCLPEVAGNVALVAEVKDAEAFARTLGRGLNDQEFRASAAINGPAHARSFSWVSSSKAILSLCESLGSGA